MVTVLVYDDLKKSENLRREILSYFPGEYTLVERIFSQSAPNSVGRKTSTVEYSKTKFVIEPPMYV